MSGCRLQLKRSIAFCSRAAAPPVIYRFLVFLATDTRVYILLQADAAYGAEYRSETVLS